MTLTPQTAPVAEAAPNAPPDQDEVIVPRPQAKPQHPVALLKATAAEFENLFSPFQDELTRIAVIALEAGRQIRENADFRSDFDEASKLMGFKFQKETHVFTRVALFTMGKHRRSSASKMSSILRRFDLEKDIQPQHLPDWVTNKGGWEAAAAKAAKRPTPAESIKDKILNAIEWAKSADVLGEFTDSKTIGSKEFDGCTVSVNFKSPSGPHKFNAVFHTSAKAAVKPVLLVLASRGCLSSTAQVLNDG